MHASIWKFNGDPDDLLRRFDAMSAEIPSENIRLQLVLRASDGFVLVDTCPSKLVFDGFVQSDAFNALRIRHGLPEPDELEDFPVHTAVVEGKALA